MSKLIEDVLNSHMHIITYDQLKSAVRHGNSIMSILKRTAVGQPTYITVELYKRAKEELWVETQPQKKTKAGKLIYG